MDEIEFYERALSEAEIKAIFDAGIVGKCRPGSVRAAYVANARSNSVSVSVIDTTTNTVVATVLVGSNPADVVLR